MHPAMKNILPGIDKESGAEELECRYKIPIQSVAKRKLPPSKSRNKDLLATLRHNGLNMRILAASEHRSERRQDSSNSLSQGDGVDPGKSQYAGDQSLENTQSRGPEHDVVLVLASVLGLVKDSENGASDGLDDML